MDKNLLDNTHFTHPDYSDLEKALAKMEAIAHYINQQKKNAELVAGVASKLGDKVVNDLVLSLFFPSIHSFNSIQFNLFSLPFHFLFFFLTVEQNLSKFKYLREGPLVVTAPARKSRYVFLFNSLVIIAKVKETTNQKKAPLRMKVKMTIPFKSILHVEPLDGTFFQVVAVDRSYGFEAPTPLLKEEWLKAFRNASQQSVTRERSQTVIINEYEKRTMSRRLTIDPGQPPPFLSHSAEYDHHKTVEF
jgi:hypothetical protein